MPNLTVNRNTTAESFKAFAQQVDRDHHVLANEIHDNGGRVIGFELYTDKKQHLEKHEGPVLGKKYKTARKAVNYMLSKSGRIGRLRAGSEALDGDKLKGFVREGRVDRSRYQPASSEQQVKDELFRDNNPRNIREKLDEVAAQHKTKPLSRRRRLWDWNLGAEAKGKSSLGPAGTRQATQLQSLRAHRDRRVLLQELAHLSATPRDQMTDGHRDRQVQLVGELSMALGAQSRQLELLRGQRRLTPAELQWAASLEASRQSLGDIDGRLQQGDLNPVQADQVESLQALFDSEPLSVAGLSANRHLAEAARVKDPELERSYRQASLGDVLRTASDHDIAGPVAGAKDLQQRAALLEKYTRSLGPDDSYSVDGLRGKLTALKNRGRSLQQQIDQLEAGIDAEEPDDTAKAEERKFDLDLVATMRRNLARIQAEIDPLEADLQRLDDTEPTIAYGHVLRAVENKGLLTELEGKLGATPGVGHPIEYRRADGSTLRVHPNQVDSVLNGWRQEHQDVARAAARTRWSRFKGWVGRRFAWVQGLKTATKGVDVVVEAESTRLQGSPDKGSEAQRLDAAAKGFDFTEHVAGLAVSVKGVFDKQQVIGAKKAKKRMGAALVERYDNALDNAGDDVRPALEIRSGVVAEYGKKLQNQSVGLDRTEQVMLGGHALRHGAQVGAGAMKVAGTAVAAGAAAATGGLAGAVVFETGEAFLAAYETGKGIITKQALDGVASQQSSQIVAKYQSLLGDGKAATVANVRARKEELEQELAGVENDLNDLQGDDDDELDVTVRKGLEERKGHLEELVGDMQADLDKLGVTQSLIDLLKDRQNVGTKALVTGQKTLAALGYGVGLVAVVGVGGLALTIAPIAAGLATSSAIGLMAYKSGKDSFEQWRTDRSADALLGRADPKVVTRLKQQAEDQGISPQQVALNHLARQDPRYMAAQHLYKLKSETELVRWTDRELQTLGQRGDLAATKAAHQAAILASSETARFLRDTLKMPPSAIAAIVDASNDDEHDEVGRKLIEEYLEAD